MILQKMLHKNGCRSVFTSLPRSVADDVQLVLGSPFFVDRFVSFDKKNGIISIAEAVDNHPAAPEHHAVPDHHAGPEHAGTEHHALSDHHAAPELYAATDQHSTVDHRASETDHHTTAKNDDKSTVMTDPPNNQLNE